MNREEYMQQVAEAKRAMRPADPEWPHCCATCELLDDTGYCRVFGEYPPLEFLSQENDCEKFELLIPF